MKREELSKATGGVA